MKEMSQAFLLPDLYIVIDRKMLSQIFLVDFELRTLKQENSFSHVNSTPSTEKNIEVPKGGFTVALCRYLTSVLLSVNLDLLQ